MRRAWILRCAQDDGVGCYSLRRHSERSEESKETFAMGVLHRSWVYILASRKNGTLYVGVTTNLQVRVWQHKFGDTDGCTKQHRVSTLVYFEELHDVRRAINREKSLKGWSRSRKVALIESTNPDWDDLAATWFERGLDPSRGSG